MIQAMAIVHPGFEDISAAELKSLGASRCRIFDSVVLCNFPSAPNLLSVAYQSRSISRLLLLLKQIKVSPSDEISSVVSRMLNDSVLKSALLGQSSFKISCVREGNHSFTSQDIFDEFGAAVHNKYSIPASMASPDVELFVFVKGEFLYLCVDTVRVDLSKRPYRIFSSPKSVKGVVAYSMLSFAGFNGSQIIIDPCCGSGEIVIEASLKKINRSPFFYNKKDFGAPKNKAKVASILEKIDKEKESEDSVSIFALDPLMSNVVQAKKNAKIAGVHDNIRFSRLNPDWLDIKFEEGRVDLIVTIIPSPSKSRDERAVSKIYDELFYQAEFILSRKGFIVIGLLKSDLLCSRALEKGFSVVEKRTIQLGKQPFDVVKFKKK